MSVHSQSTEPQERTLNCGHCQRTTPSREAVKGSFCSEACYFAHKGAKQLRNIQQDHRFCSSCFRPLKTVYRPDDSECYELRKKALIIRESFVGFETATQFAERGMFGLECKCGTVEHSHSEELFRDGEAYEWYLKCIFEQLRHDGQLDATFDIGTFADSFWEHDDIERAVGEALFE